MKWLLTIVFLTCVGCSNRVYPPVGLVDPVAVYVADYGKHSSLLLPTDAGVLTEYSFGDWDWYASNSTQVKDAVRALLFSRGAAFGRREILAEGVGEGGEEVIRRRVRCLRVVGLRVERPKAAALACTLDYRFDRHRDSAVYNELAELTLVRDEERYGITHTCNHATAEWLEELGCRVRGMNVLSNFVVDAGAGHGGVAPGATR